ncbi:MAG: RpiB/LacA/LacB family sugar-phosphate isomerase [Oscillospiraceae bacterium]|nr:RpiB/LacA/LacB family sugar-phosphate isomerase [Oscillospiraceae bacterium]
MRIAVINEFSARDKNPLILKALEPVEAEIFNVGMSESGPGPELTYVHTGLMAGMALRSGAADFVVGGCGTGQGFTISAMQYPGVFCGLITSPLDAWLFSQINGGNCVSLALNKGFGWAGDINLRYIFEKLFLDPSGQGYPPARRESQKISRDAISRISEIARRGMPEILKAIEPAILKPVMSHGPFVEFIEEYGGKTLW